MITYDKYHENYYEITFNHNSFIAEYKISRMLNMTIDEYSLLLQSYGGIKRWNESHLNLSCCFFTTENEVRNAVDGINSILVMRKLENEKT